MEQLGLNVMNKHNAQKFLKKLTELSVEHGIRVEGSCPIPPALGKLESKDVPGKYKLCRATCRDPLFHWVSRATQ